MRPAEGRTAAKKPGSMVCGKWKVERVIRVTEQLATYEAKDLSGAKVYLKVLHPYKADDASLVARLKREAYVANRIKHPSMVRILGDGTTDEGSVVIALELVDGDTLEELRVKRGGTLPAEDVIKYGIALCEALQAAHDEHVVHRDVRPDSFVVSKKGELRVPEFSSARVLGESVEARERTAAGATLGSPAFMSPEQARGQRDRVDARTDVFSLGATLYTLVSGKTVHPSDNPLAGLLAASRERAKPIRSVVRAPIPDFLADAIDRALKFEPTDRFPSMRAFRKALAKDEAAPKPVPRTSVSPKADLGTRPSQMPPPPLARPSGAPLLGRPPTAQPFAPSAPVVSGASAPPKAAVSVAPGPQIPRAPAVPSFGASPAAPTVASPVRERAPKPELPRSEPSDEVTALMPLPPPGASHHPSSPPAYAPGQGGPTPYGQQPGMQQPNPMGMQQPGMHGMQQHANMGMQQQQHAMGMQQHPGMQQQNPMGMQQHAGMQQHPSMGMPGMQQQSGMQQHANMGMQQPGMQQHANMGMQQLGMQHHAMGHGMQAGGSGPFGAMPLAPQPAGKPDRTMAFVAAGVGVALIVCALVYALVFMKPT